MGGNRPGGRIVLLVTSSRVAPGLLTWRAWAHLRAADVVLAADPDPAWVRALDDAGVALDDIADNPVAQRAGRLVTEAVSGRTVVWLGSTDGDPGLTDALAEHMARHAVAGTPPEIEVAPGSHDLPGARLLDVATLMDRLRSPGGCPWDAAQSHESLLPYLLEEAHEVIEAVEAGDRAHLREELGDLLLQVAFHARIAQEHDSEPFDIDDVAAGIVAKLVRRHPHVFERDPEATPEAAEDLQQTWDELKAAEKPGRGVLDGIPATLPALARAQKVVARLERARLLDEESVERAAADDPLAAALLAAVLAAEREGLDAEATLRRAVGRLTDAHRGEASGTMGE
jgi:XTP/dITP diphosphohydrolase